MRRSLLLTAAAAALLASQAPSSALQVAKPGRADPRIKTLDYDPSQVVRLVGSFRTATEVAFSPQESITHVALGDSSAWDVAAETNLLFLKPKVRRGLTNLIVTTDKAGETRTYTFELSTRSGENAGHGASTYFQLRFRYPEDRKLALASVITKQEAALQQKIQTYQLDRGALEGPRNLDYVEQGASALAPSEISDNGRFTVLRFPGAQSIPALYTVGADGAETLAPFDVRGDFVVIHGVTRGLRLRLNRAVLCIWNNAYARSGSSGATSSAPLPTSTASPQVMRVDKSGSP